MNKAIKLCKKVFDYAVPLAIVAVAWQLVTMSGVFPEVLLPPPAEVITRFIKLVLNGTIARNVIESFSRVIIGFFVASIAGISIGVAIAEVKIARFFLKPLIEIFQPIPKLAWIPLIILWFGFSSLSAVAIIFLGAFWPIVLNTEAGVKAVNKVFIRSARSLGAKNWFVFTRLLLPAALPSILTGLRLGIARAWRALVAAEMLIATAGGLGYMIFSAREFFRTEDIIIGMLILSAIGLILEKGIFVPIERRTVKRWGLIR